MGPPASSRHADSKRIGPDDTRRKYSTTLIFAVRLAAITVRILNVLRRVAGFTRPNAPVVVLAKRRTFDLASNG